MDDSPTRFGLDEDDAHTLDRLLSTIEAETTESGT